MPLSNKYIAASVKFSVMAEIHWPFVGDVDDPNWAWCEKYATFKHQGACEFIVHATGGMRRHILKSMSEAGCTHDFIAAYRQAANTGAQRVMFWW